MEHRYAIEINHLTKRFMLQDRNITGLKGVILHLPEYIKGRVNAKSFVALDDVSFNLRQGETLGLVGPNGCGKTTLLSIIGKVIRRYEGKVSIHGRIGMMLALGAGFANELSGRENIILNCVLLGYTRKQTMSILDEVIDFADIGDFIDRPLFQYSTGMQMRLGFAVATVVDPDILLVDEAMAVGDAAFVHKCGIKIKQLLSRNVSLILVSHNPHDIQNYCRRVIALERGKICFDGPTSDYFEMVHRNQVFNP